MCSPPFSDLSNVSLFTPPRKVRGKHSHHDPTKLTGAWKRVERLAFLKGLRMHGRGQWKLIAKMVPTRDNIQIKSRGQLLAKKADRGENIFLELDAYYEEKKAERPVIAGRPCETKREACNPRAVAAKASHKAMMLAFHRSNAYPAGAQMIRTMLPVFTPYIPRGNAGRYNPHAGGFRTSRRAMPLRWEARRVGEGKAPRRGAIVIAPAGVAHDDCSSAAMTLVEFSRKAVVFGSFR